jgi:hypothetical protein
LGITLQQQVHWRNISCVKKIGADVQKGSYRRDQVLVALIARSDCLLFTNYQMASSK